MSARDPVHTPCSRSRSAAGSVVSTWIIVLAVVLAYAVPATAQTVLHVPNDSFVSQPTDLGAASFGTIGGGTTGSGSGEFGTRSGSVVAKRPQAPTHLLAVPMGPTQIRVTWQDNAADITHHVLEIKEHGPGSFLTIPFTLVDDVRAVDLVGLQVRTSYLVRIRSANDHGVSAPTNVAAETTWRADAPCEVDVGRLCLKGGRFSVEVLFRDHRVSVEDKIAHAVPLTDSSGLFWFFSPENIELVVDLGLIGRFTKSRTADDGGTEIDYGAGPADRFDRLEGFSPDADDTLFKEISLVRTGLSDLEYWILLTDLRTGATQVHYNSPYQLCNTKLFQLPSAGSSDGSASCSSDAETLCFHEGRFELRLDWIDEFGGTQPAEAMIGTKTTGFFLENPYAPTAFAVKVLDGRALNGNYWLYFGNSLPREARLKVLDTQSGVEHVMNHQVETCELP